MRPTGCQLPIFVSFIPEATYFFYKIALSVLEPTVRLLIYHGVCVDVASTYIWGNTTFANSTDPAPCRETLASYPDLEDRVQSEAADYMIISKILMNVPAIILGFFCGGWSDIVGRRLPMFLTCAGSCIAVIFYLISLVGTGAAIPFVLFATFVHSIFGRNSVITMAVHSSVTDLTTKDERTNRLGRLLAMNFLGQFCGSLLLGLLLDRVGFVTILCVVFVLFGLCCVFVTVFLPETVHTAPPILSSPVVLAQSSKELCQLHHIRDSVLVVARPRANRLRLYLIICLVCLCINQTCKAGEVDVTLLYVRHRPLEWEKSEYGYLLAVNFAAIGLCLLFVLPLLSGRFAIRDTTIIIGVVCFKIVRLIIMAFARYDWLVYISTLLDSPIGMVISCLKSIISKITDESETGKAFAIQASIETASGMFGAMVFNSLYDISFRYFLGTTFLVEAFVYLGLLGCAIWMWKTLDAHYKTDYDQINAESEEAIMLNPSSETGMTADSKSYGSDALAVSNPHGGWESGSNGVVSRQQSSSYGSAANNDWNSSSVDYNSNSNNNYDGQYNAISGVDGVKSPATEDAAHLAISWSSSYQQPSLQASNEQQSRSGQQSHIRVQQTQYGHSYSVPANSTASSVMQQDFTSIGAPPPPPSRSRAGEPPPASIARPRPQSTRRVQPSAEDSGNSSSNNNNNDQLGALSQYR